ncbi:hypothetical protein LP419_30495 [Massilia sp. H-1]|nr:hypothetical protein LP419_30495 [Massilia sp. H-1]
MLVILPPVLWVASGALSGEDEATWLSQLVAVGIEIGRVRDNHAARFAIASCLDGSLVRHGQDLARLQAVHIVAA